MLKKYLFVKIKKNKKILFVTIFETIKQISTAEKLKGIPFNFCLSRTQQSVFPKTTKREVVSLNHSRFIQKT